VARVVFSYAMIIVGSLRLSVKACSFRRQATQRGPAIASHTKHNARHGYTDKNSPVITALEQVFESVGDGVSFRDGSVVGSPEAIERLRTRAGMGAGKESFVSYVDRQGKLHLPFDEAFELGRKFCASEPSTVLVEVKLSSVTGRTKPRTERNI